MKSPVSTIVVIFLTLALQGCSKQQDAASQKGGNGSDTFVFDARAAQLRTAPEKPKKPVAVKAEERPAPRSTQ